MWKFKLSKDGDRRLTTIGTICSILSIPLFFFDKAVSYFESISNLPNFWKTLFIWIGNIAMPLLVIGIVVILIRIIRGAIRSQTMSLMVQRRLAADIHQNLNHRIRNEIVELDVIRRKVIEYRKLNQTEAIKELYNHEYDLMQKNLEDYIDSLSEYLSEYRNDEISVCIKLFKSRDENRQIFDDEIVITEARSSNTRKKREKNMEESSIRSNTDFHNLCSGRNVFFGSSNLQKLSESGQYESDSESWSNNSPPYVSTIVTPIRYYNNEHNRIKIDIIGFLCIDSLKEIKEWENPNSFELQIMAIYSDMLYIYLKEFYRCFE